MDHLDIEDNHKTLDTDTEASRDNFSLPLRPSKYNHSSTTLHSKVDVISHPPLKQSPTAESDSDYSPITPMAKMNAVGMVSFKRGSVHV